MAGVVYTFTSSVKVPGLATLPADPAVPITGDYSVEVEVDVPAGAVSQAIPISVVDFSKVIALAINADKVAMDVFTNAGNGAGGQHFALPANASLTWNNTLNQTAFPQPLTQNITEFFVNNATTKPGIFRAGFLMQV